MSSSTLLFLELCENPRGRLFIVADASAALRGLSRFCMSSIKDKHKQHYAKDYRVPMLHSTTAAIDQIVRKDIKA